MLESMVRMSSYQEYLYKATLPYKYPESLYKLCRHHATFWKDAGEPTQMPKIDKQHRITPQPCKPYSMYVCMYVCMFIHIYMYIYIYR